MKWISTLKYSQPQTFLHYVTSVHDILPNNVEKDFFISSLMMSFFNGLPTRLINMSLITRKTGLIQSGMTLMLGKFKHILLYLFAWIWLKHR